LKERFIIDKSLVAATGTGKTVILRLIIKNRNNNKSSKFFVAHRKKFCNKQSHVSRSFKDNNFEIYGLMELNQILMNILFQFKL
jgi:superfamily II DNA or RNA helicase